MTIGADGTIACSLDAKKSKNFWRISAEVMWFIDFNGLYSLLKAIFALNKMVQKYVFCLSHWEDEKNQVLL